MSTKPGVQAVISLYYNDYCLPLHASHHCVAMQLGWKLRLVPATLSVVIAEWICTFSLPALLLAGYCARSMRNSRQTLHWRSGASG